MTFAMAIHYEGSLSLISKIESSGASNFIRAINNSMRIKGAEMKWAAIRHVIATDYVPWLIHKRDQTNYTYYQLWCTQKHLQRVCFQTKHNVSHIAIIWRHIYMNFTNKILRVFWTLNCRIRKKAHCLNSYYDIICKKEQPSMIVSKMPMTVFFSKLSPRSQWSSSESTNVWFKSSFSSGSL